MYVYCEVDFEGCAKDEQSHIFWELQLQYLYMRAKVSLNSEAQLTTPITTFDPVDPHFGGRAWNEF